MVWIGSLLLASSLTRSCSFPDFRIDFAGLEGGRGVDWTSVQCWYWKPSLPDENAGAPRKRSAAKRKVGNDQLSSGQDFKTRPSKHARARLRGQGTAREASERTGVGIKARAKGSGSMRGGTGEYANRCFFNEAQQTLLKEVCAMLCILNALYFVPSAMLERRAWERRTRSGGREGCKLLCGMRLV